MNAIICIGCSASGKSTYADSLGKDWFKLERDVCRRALIQLKYGVYTGNMWSKWDSVLEPRVNDFIDEQLKYAASNKLNIICSDTNVSFKSRDKMVKALTELGYSITYKYFDVDIEELIERDANRIDSVGANVIQRQFDMLSRIDRRTI